MINLLLDIAPKHGHHSGESGRVIIRHTHRVLTDTIDTVAAPVQQVSDSAAPDGNNLTIILGGILAALIALGVSIYMVRVSRKRGEQQLQLSEIKS